MAPGQTRTLRLPGGILITVIALAGTATVDLLRKAAYEADLYLLYGATYSAPSPSTAARGHDGAESRWPSFCAVVDLVAAAAFALMTMTHRGLLL